MLAGYSKVRASDPEISPAGNGVERHLIAVALHTKRWLSR